jgi:hypothetical protein
MELYMKTIMVGLLFCLTVGFVSAQNAVIKDVVGTVEIKAPGESAWKTAAAGQQITNATAISTGFKSTALIALNNSLITVQPLTRLSLEELVEIQGNERVSLNLQTGRVRAAVNPPAGGKTDFTVRSPIATASVRGTSFDFDGVNLSVAEGRVQIAGGDGTPVYVAAGNEVATDPETGRTQTAAEAFAESLTPNVPVGIETGSSSSSSSASIGTLIIEANNW